VGDAAPLSVRSEGVELACERAGEGPAILALHGLSATRRYVLMGSRSLERSGHTVISYDARGHGSSSAAPGRAYSYEHLAADALAVLDAAGVGRALLAGVSMGAHTAVRVAGEHPERVAALCLITPGVDPEHGHSAEELSHWQELADALRSGGIDGFVRACGLDPLPPAWRALVEMGVRQRMAAHRDLHAVADALESVPRTRHFDGMRALASISVPTMVIGSRDDADPDHPLALAERYAGAIAGAELHVEEAPPPLRSPLAWQGGRVSKLIAGLASRAGHT
jgi:3-oxoadipate enol-lactonase